MRNDMQQFEIDEREKSKSQIKREFAELQNLGEQLVALKPGQFTGFRFTQSMLDALVEYTRIKNRTAQRRHIRRIGRLLADEDVNRIRSMLERIDSNHLEKQRRSKLMEYWRERLILEGDSALNDLAQLCQELDRHHLRQLIRAAQKEQQAAKPATTAKKILNYLKELPLE